MMKTYTQFNKSTGVVMGRLTIPDDVPFPDDLESIFVEGFFTSDFVYDFETKMPVQKLAPKAMMAPAGYSEVQDRAFGDNISFTMLNPWFAVVMWRRVS